MVTVVYWLLSMPAVQVVISSALTICFGFASRDDTFDVSASYILSTKVLVLAFAFGFRAGTSNSNCSEGQMRTWKVTQRPHCEADTTKAV